MRKVCGLSAICALVWNSSSPFGRVVGEAVTRTVAIFVPVVFDGFPLLTLTRTLALDIDRHCLKLSLLDFFYDCLGVVFIG